MEKPKNKNNKAQRGVGGQLYFNFSFCSMHPALSKGPIDVKRPALGLEAVSLGWLLPTGPSAAESRSS